MEYRTLLRRAGYFFVPVKDDELALFLDGSTVKDDKVIETAELKATRENFLRVRMSTWLQVPKEAPWLDTTIEAFIRAMKGLWRADADFSSVKARSNWIMDQVDVRGWAHSLGGANGDNYVKTGRGAHILMILSPPADAPREVKYEYWSWAEERILAPIKEQYPNLYCWIVDWQRTLTSKMADLDLTKGDAE